MNELAIYGTGLFVGFILGVRFAIWLREQA